MEEELMEKIKRAAEILRSYGATEVYLFGSVPKGTYTTSSDIDLAVRGIPPKDFYGAVGEMLFALDRSVDLIDLDGGTAFGKYLEKQGELTRVL
jgi:predicted nucleotidyltransferase